MTPVRLVRGYLFAAALAFSTLAGPGLARAGVVIESSSADSGAGRVMIAGDKARIESGDGHTYMLLDLGRRQVLVVNTREGYAMDLTSPLPRHSRHAELATSGGKQPDVRLEPSGAGPSIAGFPTTRYRVMVDDTHCRDEFLAAGPLEERAIRRFITTMAAASSNEQRMFLILLTDEGRECEAAEDLVDDHYADLGIPMRSVTVDGELLHEITRIRFDATPPADALELPDDIPVLTRSQVRERHQGAPDPEALQQRRRHIMERMRELQRNAHPDDEGESR